MSLGLFSGITLGLSGSGSRRAPSRSPCVPWVSHSDDGNNFGFFGFLWYGFIAVRAVRAHFGARTEMTGWHTHTVRRYDP